VTRRRGAAAAISESNMGEGQVPKMVKGHILLSPFFTASNYTRRFRRVPASVGIDRKERMQAELGRDLLSQVSSLVLERAGNLERNCDLGTT
jgi:hypothetical protein